MQFNFTEAKGAAQASSRITPGIHNAKFLGMEKSTANNSPTILTKWEVEGFGGHNAHIFEPLDSERKPNAWGGTTPSSMDHFLIRIRQILLALDDKLIDAIDNGSPVVVNDKPVTLGGANFSQVAASIIAIANLYIGKEVELKFLPNNDFVNIAWAFPATITRAGNLGYSTTFIGKNLVLSSNELKKIENAKNATPTKMKSTVTTDILDDMKADLDVDDSDLPVF